MFGEEQGIQISKSTVAVALGAPVNYTWIRIFRWEWESYLCVDWSLNTELGWLRQAAERQELNPTTSLGELKWVSTGCLEDAVPAVALIRWKVRWFMPAEYKTCVRAVRVVICSCKEMELLLQMRPKGRSQGECLLALSLLLLKACHVWAVDVPHAESLTYELSDS